MPRIKPVSEKEKSNLNPIKKGEVRNPKGRPKGALSLVTLLKEALEGDYIVYEKDEEGKIKLDDKSKPIIKKKIKQKDAVILALLSKAVQDKDMQAINSILTRVDGVPTQTVVTEDETGKKAAISFNYIIPKNDN